MKKPLDKPIKYEILARKIPLSALDLPFLTFSFMNTKCLIVRRATHMLEFFEQEKMIKGNDSLFSVMYRKFISDYSILSSAHVPLR